MWFFGILSCLAEKKFLYDALAKLLSHSVEFMFSVLRGTSNFLFQQEKMGQRVHSEFCIRFISYKQVFNSGVSVLIGHYTPSEE